MSKQYFDPEKNLEELLKMNAEGVKQNPEIQGDSEAPPQYKKVN